jgi:hypothetical protein
MAPKAFSRNSREKNKRAASPKAGGLPFLSSRHFVVGSRRAREHCKRKVPKSPSSHITFELKVLEPLAVKTVFCMAVYQKVKNADDFSCCSLGLI